MVRTIRQGHLCTITMVIIMLMHPDTIITAIIVTTVTTAITMLTEGRCIIIELKA